MIFLKVSSKSSCIQLRLFTNYKKSHGIQKLSDFHDICSKIFNGLFSVFILYT